MFLPEIAANFIANVIFWLLIGGIAWLTYRLTLQRKFESLFGLENENALVIYLSNLWDPSMTMRPWGEIIAGNELHAASEIQGVITGLAPRFPALVRGLAEEWFLKDKFRMTIQVSPREECIPPHNMVVIGATTKNSVRRCLLQEKKLLVRISGESIIPPKNIHHNPLGNKFIISRHNGDETHEVSEGLSPAIVERVMVGDELDPNRQRVAFMCVGRTGFETRKATEYLAQKWRDLERSFKHYNHFARCLALDRNGIVVHHFDVVAE